MNGIQESKQKIFAAVSAPFIVMSCVCLLVALNISIVAVNSIEIISSKRTKRNTYADFCMEKGKHDIFQLFDNASRASSMNHSTRFCAVMHPTLDFSIKINRYQYFLKRDRYTVIGWKAEREEKNRETLFLRLFACHLHSSPKKMSSLDFHHLILLVDLHDWRFNEPNATIVSCFGATKETCGFFSSAKNHNLPHK